MSEPHHKLVALLNELIALDYDAIEAYRVAIKRLEETTYQENLASFCEDHERHTGKLAQLAAGFGGQPAHGPDLKQLLTKGNVVIADLIGEDRAILSAMRLNEEVTNTAYDAALALEALEPTVLEILETNRSDERRHRAWIEQALA